MIQFKAAFLITVFSLNTIVGFACAIGINMGFNATHHHHEEVSMEMAEHMHSHGDIHHHKAVGKDHHDAKDGKDDCCKDRVIKFNFIDKSSANSLNAVVNPVNFTNLCTSFHNIDSYYTSNITSTKYFVRSYHPPIPDIRVAIQSFQI